MKRFTATSEISYVGKMLLVQVQVKSAFVVAVRVVLKCRGDVRPSFFFFTVGLGGGEGVHLDVNFE